MIYKNVMITSGLFTDSSRDEAAGRSRAAGTDLIEEAGPRPGIHSVYRRFKMEQEKKTVEKSGIGTVKIADEVVTLIVAYAALDVDGVAYIAGNVDRAILSKGGVRKLGKNVKVEVSKNGVKAELAIILEYGYNIPATSSKVQNKTAVETMTGLKVLDVDIRIAGINIPE